MRCKDYLNSSTFTTLTISNIVKLKDLQMKAGYNIFTQPTLSPTSPILIKMGSIPVLKFSSSTVYFTSVIDPFPDFTFQTLNNSIDLNTKLSNIKWLNDSITTGNLSNKKYWNMFIKFEYNSNVFALISYNKTYTYKSLGTFAFRVASSYGVNDLIASRSIITVQSIQSYPFTQMVVNKFTLNCSLTGLNLSCFIQLNISNYGQSNQVITLDFNDGSFQDIEVNSYCKLNFKLNSIFFLFFLLNVFTLKMYLSIR